jgi:histidine ammonia-lyase
LTAARGVALRDVDASPATQPIVDLVNHATGGPGADRFLSPEIDAVVELVQSGRILAAAEKTTGTLD